MPTVISESYAGRIKAAADHARDCHDRWKAALQARNELIVDAIDHGYTGHQAARDAGVRQPHIIRICSSSQPEVSPVRR
jgi:hypothetical protein